MDVQIAKKLIAEQIFKINEEWILKAIFKLIGIDEKAADDEFVKRYEAKLKPMTKEEYIQQVLEAEEDIKAGRVIDIDTYFNSIDH